MDMAHRGTHQQKIVTAPKRQTFPKRWKRNDEVPLYGKIIDLWRTDGRGMVRFWEQDF
jgi:hypothetical protein